MLFKKSILFFVFIFCFISLTRAQKILIDDYKIILNNVKPFCNDSLTKYVGNDRKVVVHLSDCMGKMYVKVYKNNKILEEGNYVNSLDTLKGYTYKNTLGGEKEIVVEKYFQPLRNGVWVFYKHKGNILRKVNYKNGVRIQM
jgi:antitoxin component YwqK of YwqJK toxin-antitoxin module